MLVREPILTAEALTPMCFEVGFCANTQEEKVLSCLVLESRGFGVGFQVHIKILLEKYYIT